MTSVKFQYPPRMLEEAYELIAIDQGLSKIMKRDIPKRLEIRSSHKGIIKQFKSTYLLINDPSLVSRKERAKYAYIHSELFEKFLQEYCVIVQKNTNHNNQKENKKKDKNIKR